MKVYEVVHFYYCKAHATFCSREIFDKLEQAEKYMARMSLFKKTKDSCDKVYLIEHNAISYRESE